MVKRCVMCDEKIGREFGKLNGSLLKVRDEYGERQFIYVCSECMKKPNWIENAKIKGA